MFEKLDDWFCENWRNFWRWWSVWLHTIGTLLAAVFLLVPSMPAEVQALLPESVRAALIAVWYFGGLWARLKQQKGKPHA